MGKYPQKFQAHGLRRGDVFSDGRVVWSKSSWYHVNGDTYHTVWFTDRSYESLQSGEWVTVLGKDYGAVKDYEKAVVR